MIHYCPMIRLCQRDGISPLAFGIRFYRTEVKDKWLSWKVIVAVFNWSRGCCYE